MKRSALALSVVLLAPLARAAEPDTAAPAAPATRVVEIEPHFAFMWDPSVYGTPGVGVGARVGVVLVRAKTIAKADDEISLELGGAWVHHECPWTPTTPGPLTTFACPDAHGIWLPAALQWSFFAPSSTHQWSLFLEAGAAMYVSLYGTCPPGAKCDLYAHVGARPLIALGARWQPARHVALTIHAGYPMLAAGVSIW